ncbi:hypothetical protein [Streptomyces mooreae]|uniref:hypothetical protein n=1 Tax=Streptomyces mooreae TaxID=3075523 RepID=UPI00374E1D15
MSNTRCAEGRCRPLSLIITPGQRADCTRFEAVMDKIRVPRTGLGRPRRTLDMGYVYLGTVTDAALLIWLRS